MAALLFGAGRHADHVGTRPRLAHGQRTDMLARNEPGQIFALLRGGSVTPDLVDAEIGMGAVGQPHRRGTPAHFLHRHHMGEIAHAGAAEFLLDRNAEKAERAQTRPKLARKFVAAVDFGGDRRDLGCGEAAHAVAQHIDLGAELEIERRVAIGGHGAARLPL
jgi:hypothetical protein